MKLNHFRCNIGTSYMFKMKPRFSFEGTLFKVSVLLLVFTDLARAHNNLVPISEDTNPYRHREVLDPRGRYVLEWLVDWDNSQVIFNVTVQTRGWIGFGLSKNGKMRGADLIIGGIDSNGSSYLMDMHVIGQHTPVQDINQDWILQASWENSSHTSLSFSRAFDTCDEHDIPITDDLTKIIWSYGETDTAAVYHHENRGLFTVYLRDPDLTPRVVRHAGRSDDSLQKLQSVNDGQQTVKIWSIKDRFQIPRKRTTYWCNIHKLSLGKKKHHIIGLKYNINQEARAYMHHALLYRCIIPLGVDPTLVFEPLVNYPGNECYSQSQSELIPAQYCTDLKAGQAIGGIPVFFGDHVGIPIGDSAENEYFLMQTHYDNPDLQVNITADIQFDIYYTDTLRENDAGIMSLGHHIPGSPSILVPPGEVNHKIFGHCSSSCTKTMLPPEGIKVMGALLHTHLSGRRIRVQHFRNNRELPWILNDDNYDPLYQPVRFVREESTILPGDQVSVQCHYDTTSRNHTLVGGYGTPQEMCKIFMVYYNRLEDYPVCRSEIMDEEYMKKYLAGTLNATWDQTSLERRATVATTPQVIGMTLSEISDSPYVDWNIDLRGELRRDHIILPHVAICPSLKEAAVFSIAPIITRLLPRDFVSHPVEAIPFKPPRRCLLEQF